MNANLIRSAIHVAAVCGMYLATAMLLPALVDLYYRDDHWRVFAVSAFMTGGISLLTATATRGAPPPFSKRFGFILVNVLWIVFSIAGVVPIYFSSLGLTFGQAIFEAVSAVTTTGSTSISGLDAMPKGLLMWRSLLHWLGGIGIVALGLFILPFLRVGGMSFFRMESSDNTSDRPFARLATFTRAFIAIYVGATALCAVAYDIGGMTRFDAINHAMSTISTGGFSTHDASFGNFGDNRFLLWTATFFMLLGSLPFSIMILFAVRRRVDTLRDPQIVVFLGYVCVFSILAAVYNHLKNGVDFGYALTHSFFNFASIFSTTGFASEDYTQWGAFVVAASFIATFMGGCSGSTSGGIKAYRFVILFQTVHVGLKKLIYPDAVYSVRYGRLTVDAETQKSVLVFFFAFVFIWAMGSLAMGALGYDIATSLSSVLTALANVGPGVGNVIGPAGNFSAMNDPAFYLLSFLMLLGRLEVLSVMVLLLPTFWRN
ncbi:TrkH family potassium uptake protein [Rhizobiaceae bacterium BDR2-2]|uniref:Trk system potassium uptake protein n=1 Tax=Ectorhizobium quercum TaxID=2965071 RepID=A0AAE3MZK4_9HYPH|nr:TrkH family potassium uptake protein [Ectorhizobium quercum]MCX8997849.1 TrkH family potassium uptake protein [Ectorhizobium quercum]